MPRADSARADAGTAADRTPCRRVAMPRFSRQPREFFRTLFTATVKEAAHLPSAGQSCSEDMMGDHASMLRDRRAAAPTRLTRCARAQPLAESHGWSSGSAREQQRHGDPRHVGAREKYDLSVPNPPLPCRLSRRDAFEFDFVFETTSWILPC